MKPDSNMIPGIHFVLFQIGNRNMSPVSRQDMCNQGGGDQGDGDVQMEVIPPYNDCPPPVESGLNVYDG